MKKTFEKRLMSGMLSVLLMSTAVLPMSLEASASRTVSSMEGTNETDDVTLLVGQEGKDNSFEGSSSMRADDLQGTIDNYNSHFLLVIGSQFSVFLNGGMTVYESDTEGRAAINGDLTIENDGQDFKYNFGKGDYNTKTTLHDLTEDKSFQTSFIYEKQEE